MPQLPHALSVTQPMVQKHSRDIHYDLLKIHKPLEFWMPQFQQ